MLQVLLKKGDTGGMVPLHSIPEDAVVEHLYSKVRKEINPDGEWYLLFTTKNLDGYKNKSLREMNIKNNSTIALVFRTQGGSSVTPLPGWVTMTKEACNILFIEPDQNCYHAKMKCGYVISPEAMTGHVQDFIKRGCYRFTCPHCDMEWPYFVVNHVGCFTEEQQNEIESKLAEVYMEKAMGIQKCPSCYNYCHRNDQNNPRVICAVCTKRNAGQCYEFCWCCLKKWVQPGNQTKFCGNVGCDGQDPRNKYLRQCEMKNMGYTNIRCPEIRACPTCGVLIHHRGGCKTMHCEHCKKGFCFVCLCLMERGILKCGNHNVVCQVAPVQQF